jgi:hypothetical protein
MDELLVEAGDGVDSVAEPPELVFRAGNPLDKL